MSETDFQRILSSPTETYDEGLRFFMGTGVLNKTLRRIASDLEDRGIEYVVIGAVALNQHGYRRFTEDINLLLTGDGLPKPVQFPAPHEHCVEIDRVKTITLEKLVELKLASGLTAPHRLKDLADVQELIKAKNLDAAFADKLDASARDKFLELQQAVALARNQDLEAEQPPTHEREADREIE